MTCRASAEQIPSPKQGIRVKVGNEELLLQFRRCSRHGIRWPVANAVVLSFDDALRGEYSANENHEQQHEDEKDLVSGHVDGIMRVNESVCQHSCCKQAI